MSRLVPRLLEVQNLFCSYHFVPVLTGLSLHISAGEIVGLVGRNGVGKSTLLKCILGLTPPQRGSILFRGQDISRQKPLKIVRAGIGYVPQGRQVFPHLSVKENLDLVPTPRSPQPSNGYREQVLAQFPILKERQHQRAGTLSGGEQQILSIARSLLLNPSLLLIDEPTEGLDSHWADEVCSLIPRLRNQGTAILLVEHDLEVVTALCDRVYATHRGRIVYEGQSESSLTYRDELLAKMGLNFPLPLQGTASTETNSSVARGHYEKA